MAGCDVMVFDHENADANLSIANTYGSELAGDFGMIPCGEPVVRGGKCEKHKVERRKSLYSDRRRPRSSDTSPSCGNRACHVEDGETIHHLHCDDRGPGWV
jgi:hypothetical protein